MSKQPMLDMFKRVLPAADLKRKDFYQSLSEEERKGFSPWLIQRYLSSIESSNQADIERHLMLTNDLVNVDYSSIKHDPEMIWKLMTIVGTGRSYKHPWVAPPKGKKRKSNAFKTWLKEKYSHLSDDEIDIWTSSMNSKQAIDMLEQYQVTDKTIIEAANDI